MILKNTQSDFCYMFGLDLFYEIGRNENYASWIASNESKYAASVKKYTDTIKEMN